jgi:hypothetical protein
LSEPPALAIAVHRALGAAIADRDRSPAELRAVIEAAIEAAIAGFAARLGAGRPRVTVTLDDAADADAPPLRLTAADGARLPSASSWIRASSAALRRFPRAEELQRSIAGALLGAPGATVAAGVAELCLELLRADPALVGALPPSTASDPANHIVVTVHDDDATALFQATDPEAMGSELARLVWETTGIPIALRFVIDAAHPRGAAGVRIRQIDECPIPLVPEGHVLTGAPAAGEPVVPVVGNPLWLVRAEQLDPASPRIEPSWALAAALLDLVRERAPRLLCRGVLDDMYDLARAACPGSLAAAVQRLGRAQLDALVADLVRHGTPISDWRCVCQAITELVPEVVADGEPGSLDGLMPFVRVRLGARIAAMLTAGEARLRAHLVDPAWTAVARHDLSPAHAERLRADVRRAGAVGHGATRWRLVVAVDLAVRGAVADLLRLEFPHVSVVAFEEVPAWVRIEPLPPSLGAPLA